MRSRMAALLFVALFINAIPGASTPIQIPEKPRPNEPPRGAVLTGKDIEQFYCRDVERTPLTPWTPGPAEIARLEKLLPAFMASQKTPRDYKPLYEYYRQYVGAVRGGKKKICVNLFHYEHVRYCLEHADLFPFVKKAVQKGGRAEDFWKTEPVVVADGGAKYFRVQFDVETGTFSSLLFNGFSQW